MFSILRQKISNSMELQQRVIINYFVKENCLTRNYKFIKYIKIYFIGPILLLLMQHNKWCDETFGKENVFNCFIRYHIIIKSEKYIVQSW